MGGKKNRRRAWLDVCSLTAIGLRLYKAQIEEPNIAGRQTLRNLIEEGATASGGHMTCDDEVIPLQERIELVGDDADLQEVYDTERHLLYVACTRARDRLLVTGVEPTSEFLDDMMFDKGEDYRCCGHRNPVRSGLSERGRWLYVSLCPPPFES